MCQCVLSALRIYNRIRPSGASITQSASFVSSLVRYREFHTRARNARCFPFLFLSLWFCRWKVRHMILVGMRCCRCALLRAALCLCSVLLSAAYRCLCALCAAESRTLSAAARLLPEPLCTVVLVLLPFFLFAQAFTSDYTLRLPASFARYVAGA